MTSRPNPFQKSAKEFERRVKRVGEAFGIVGILLGVLAGVIFYVGKGQSYLFWAVVGVVFSSVILGGILIFLEIGVKK